MQRKKPQLKVDRIFGPELVPQRKGYPVVAWLVVLLLAGGAAGLYQYATPIWLCYRLEQDLKNAATADEAGLAAENLLALGDEGLAVVVEALADPRIEISGVAFQVLKGRLGAMTSDEIIASDWVGSLASELRKAAGTWNGESRRLGCQLAGAIYTVFETKGDGSDSDRYRWAASRLDTWAVLENYQWKPGFEPLRGAGTSGIGTPDGEALKTATASLESPSMEQSLGESSILASTSNSASPRSVPQVSGSQGSSLQSSSLQSSSSLEADEREAGSATGSRMVSSGGVRIGTIVQTEVGEESMAHIQVIPKNRRSTPTLVSNVPRGLETGVSEPEVVNVETQGALQADSAVGDVEVGDVEQPNRWEEKIQRIDTRMQDVELALKRKDVLELFLLLKSEDISTQAAAVRELDERGLSDVEIALATNLVRGDSAARVKLLLDLPRMEIGDPSRWYIWMAQNEDREVRRVAIQGLGSVADPGIATMIRELRVHEPDRELKDLLHKILQGIER